MEVVEQTYMEPAGYWDQSLQRLFVAAKESDITEHWQAVHWAAFWSSCDQRHIQLQIEQGSDELTGSNLTGWIRTLESYGFTPLGAKKLGFDLSAKKQKQVTNKLSVEAAAAAKAFG